MRFQLSSLMWHRPSTPPMSTKCTIRGQALDNAGVGLAHLNVCPELLALCLVLLSGHLVDVLPTILRTGALGDQLNVLPTKQYSPRRGA